MGGRKKRRKGGKKRLQIEVPKGTRFVKITSQKSKTDKKERCKEDRETKGER